MTISNKTLAKIAIYGGMITCTTGMILQWKLKERVRQAEYYKKALIELRKHPGAVSLLGEPILAGDINLNNDDNYCDGEKTQLEVFVKGSKQKGSLFLWANKNNDTNKWDVNRIELGLENEPNRKLLIKNESK